MMMVASSVVLTVVVLNYHHRTAETHEMPAWVSTCILVVVKYRRELTQSMVGWGLVMDSIDPRHASQGE